MALQRVGSGATRREASKHAAKVGSRSRVRSSRVCGGQRTRPGVRVANHEDGKNTSSTPDAVQSPKLCVGKTDRRAYAVAVFMKYEVGCALKWMRRIDPATHRPPTLTSVRPSRAQQSHPRAGWPRSRLGPTSALASRAGIETEEGDSEQTGGSRKASESIRALQHKRNDLASALQYRQQ